MMVTLSNAQSSRSRTHTHSHSAAHTRAAISNVFATRGRAGDEGGIGSEQYDRK